MELVLGLGIAIILVVGPLIHLTIKSRKISSINERQIIVQIPVFECNDNVENVVKTVISTYQKDSNFWFIPRINLLLDDTTEEQRKVCRLLEKDYDSIFCSYSRDMY